MTDHAGHHVPKNMSIARLAGLSIGSIGVVYGDIGTSPLYAFREALRPVSGDGVSPEEVIGLVSLMLWTLTVIVTFKYVSFLLRADNEGEGGTLALLALFGPVASLLGIVAGEAAMSACIMALMARWRRAHG